MSRLRLATVWLGGCSGCHMSFLDLDEWLFGLAANVDLVYSPLADIKEYPEGVDLALIEGAVANEDNLELIKTVRARTGTLVSFGDCAVSGNVTALRNLDGEPDPMLRRIYVEAVDLNAGEPTGAVVPKLLPKVLPVHEVVPVDVYLPGCPPSAQKIHMALESVLTGERLPARGEHTRFG